MNTTDDHDEPTEPFSDQIHENSWSANLETPRYADNPDLAVSDALVAIDHTATGNHVNLVTHADLGHPKPFLYDALEREHADIEVEYVDQCGCGGHVTRVDVS